VSKPFFVYCLILLLTPAAAIATIIQDRFPQTKSRSGNPEAALKNIH